MMPTVAISAATAMKQKNAIDGTPSWCTRVSSSVQTITSLARPRMPRLAWCAGSDRVASISMMLSSPSSSRSRARMRSMRSLACSRSTSATTTSPSAGFTAAPRRSSTETTPSSADEQLHRPRRCTSGGLMSRSCSILRRIVGAGRGT